VSTTASTKAATAGTATLEGLQLNEWPQQHGEKQQPFCERLHEASSSQLTGTGDQSATSRFGFRSIGGRFGGGRLVFFFQSGHCDWF
jgi:hypothetical protein